MTTTNFISNVNFITNHRFLLYIKGKPYIVNPTIYDSQALISFTYDDAHISQYDTALVLHEKYNLPLSIYVVSQRVSLGYPWMNETQIKDTYRRGAEIGSHSVTHPFITTLTNEEVIYELQHSYDVLSELVPIHTFAVPQSNYNDTIRDIIEGLGIYTGVRVYGALQNNIPIEDKYWVKSKIALTAETTFEEVKNAIDEAISLHKWCVIMLHQIIDDPEPNSYNIRPELLNQILQYTASIPKENLLCANFRDAINFL